MNICKDIRSIIENNLDQIKALRTNKQEKSDGSYVSEGDLLCETLIKAYIAENLENFYLISEESPEDNELAYQQENVIILDPIDGTENFVSGLTEWGVAVCYYKGGVHQQSMLALPELGLYLTTGDEIKRYNSRISGISSSLTKDDLLKLPAGFEYRIIGCAVYNMYNVVTGSYFSFENPKGAYVWDIIPGLNMALEHGLNVTVNNNPYHGELLRPNQKYIFKIWQN